MTLRELLVLAALLVVALAAAPPPRQDGAQGRLEARSKNERGILEVDGQLSPPPPLLIGWPGSLVWLAGSTVANMGQDMKLQVPRMIPGLLYLILGLLVYLGLQAFGRLWTRVEIDEDSEELEKIEADKGGFDVEQWKAEAEKGELDFYTCVALSCGRKKTAKSFLKFLPRLVLLVCMQVILPVLLLICQSDIRNVHVYPAESGHAYRAIGVLLFTYSSYNLVISMNDMCREDLLRYLHNVSGSGWYEWPLLLGETMNTFIGVSLMVIMFLIFCESTRATDLLMNCIAVNFVADIDNEVVTDEDKEEALNNVSTALDEWTQNHNTDEPTIADKLQTGLFYLNQLIRAMVPLAAIFLTMIFAFAHDESLCRRVKEVETFPFCLGYVA